MSTIAYLDTPSGISGDMFLGCLIDGGWPVARLRSLIETLHLPEGTWQVGAETVMRGPLRATLVHVHVIEGDHHRHLSDIRTIIAGAHLPASLQERAIAVFTRLAAAEAKVHGTTVEQIHFHEVGALDAIIDIVGVCAGLHELGIEQLFASPLPLGYGWASTMHGRIPLPAPATLELLAAVHAPTRPAPGPGELVTPTGAALLAELATFSQPPMTLNTVGLGAGQKEFDWPNVARLWIGERSAQGVAAAQQFTAINRAAPGQGTQNDDEAVVEASGVEEDSVVVLETNIDDMSPELFGAVGQRLFAAGALDVWTTAIGMKKNRPGVLLAVLAPAEQEESLAELLLRETTTLGVRVRPARRHIAQREMRTVETVYGEARVKLKWVGGELMGAVPEYEDCQLLAERAATPVRLVYNAVHAAAHQRFMLS